MTADTAALLAQARAHIAAAFAPPPVRHDDATLTWHPVLLADAAATSLADTLLDAVYASDAQLLQDKKVTIACAALPDGLGDLALGWRVCTTLQQHAPSACITLVVPDVAKAETLRPMPDAAAAPQNPAHVISATEAATAASRTDLWIITPSPATARHGDAALRAWLEKRRGQGPTLVVTEYGSAAAQHAQARTLATGLGPLADGVFIDPTLASRAPAQRAASHAERRDAMRTWVGAVLPHLLPLPSRVLHMIYVREEASLTPAIARSLAAHPGDLGELLIGVLRHAPIAADAAAWRAAGLKVTCDAHMLGHARLVALPPLSPDQFRTALLYADFAVVTGDQSLSEAIAAQVLFAYEARVHKQALAHRLQEIASRFGPDVHGAMAPLDAAPPPPAPPSAAWQAMCQHVCKSSNVAPRLVGRAARTLADAGGAWEHATAFKQACAAAACSEADARLLALLQQVRSTFVSG